MRKPDLSPKEMGLDPDYVCRTLGVKLSKKEISSLLRRMGYGVKSSGKSLSVSVPPYRADILHPIDLVEDVAIAYGYMNFKPEVPRIYALGKGDPLEAYCEKVRDLLVGLSFYEVMSLILTNDKDLFTRMCVDKEPAVEAEKPVSTEQGVARTWLLPSLLVVLEKNRSREYPQRLFEVGEVLKPSGETVMKTAGVIAHSKTNYSEVKATVQGLLKNLSLECDDSPHDHSSFISGRCCKNKYGFYGELSPKVLANFGIEVPVTAFEFRLN